MKQTIVFILLSSFYLAGFAQDEQELPSVQISGAKFQLAYDHPEMTIIDFDFHEKGLLILVREKSKYHLRLTDELSQHLFDLSIPRKPRELFTDCFGNQHVVYDDNVYQIAHLEQGFTLYPPISISTFKEKLAIYAVSSKSALYWQEFQDHNQSVAYVKRVEKSDYKELIYQTADSILVESVDEFHKKTLRDAAAIANPMGDISVAQLGSIRDVKERFWFYDQLLSKNIYCPILQIKDSIYIFDHCGNTAIVFDEFGFHKRSFPIAYHKAESWAKNILTDFETKLIYGEFIKNGKVHLKEINPTTGKTEENYPIVAHNFPVKIKLRDGWVYYIYNEQTANSLPNVYRQRLK